MDFSTPWTISFPIEYVQTELALRQEVYKMELFCTLDIGPSLGMFIQTYLWYENYGTWIFPHSKQLFECSYRPTFDVWGVESGFFHALDDGLSLEYVHTLHLGGPADVHQPLLDRVFPSFPEPVGLTATHGHNSWSKYIHFYWQCH